MISLEGITARFGMLLFTVAISFMAASCGGGEDVETAAEAPAEAAIDVIEPRLSIGVELGDSAYMFSSIETAIYDANGNIAVLDMGTANVRIYSPQGQFLRSIGRRGNGPGEFQRPLGMVLLGSGSLAVMDPWGEGFTEIGPDYEQKGVLLDIHSNVHIGMCSADSTDIVALRVSPAEGAGEPMPMTVGLYQLSTEPVVEYWRRDYTVNSPEDVAGAMRDFVNISWTADPASGEVYIAPYEENAYLIRRYSPRGDLLGSVEMELESVPRSVAEMEEQAAYIRARLTALNGRDMGIDIEPYTDRRSVASLGVDGEGCLWVRRGTEDEAVLDRWTPGGELLGSYLVPGSDLFWEFSFCPRGILAYNANPDEHQRLFVMDYPAMP